MTHVADPARPRSSSSGGTERLLPCCWMRAFRSSARGLTPPDLQWNPLSLVGKSLFVLQSPPALDTKRQHWEWPPTADYFFYQCTQYSWSVHRATLNNYSFVHGFNRINQPVLSAVTFHLASCSSVYIPLPTVFRFSTQMQTLLNNQNVLGFIPMQSCSIKQTLETILVSAK